MNIMQLMGKFLGEKISRIYEKVKIHTEDVSIHRTSAEIRAEITEGDIPPEIVRRGEMEQSLAGKVDKEEGKELMPSPGETPRRDRFLNEQGEYIPLDSHYLVLDATMMGEKEFSVNQEQLREYIDRAIVGGDSGLTVFFKFPFQYWNEYYKVTFVAHQLGNFYLTATHPIMFSSDRKGVREYRYHFLFDIAGERPFDSGKGMLIDSEFYVPSYLDSLLEAKADASIVQEHVKHKENPHGVTKAQVGLGNVENTADADKPVSKAMQQALDGVSGELQTHVSNTDVHKTSAQIRAEITDADIPDSIARTAEVDVKVQAHNESGEAHVDLRNALDNLENGAVKAGSAEYAERLGTRADSYTKVQLDAKLNRHIKDVVYDAEQAKFTFVFEDGREIVVDTPLENTVTDGHYDHETQELVLVLVSGQEIRIPVSGMAKVYTGKDTATATTAVSDAGEISVAVKPGSVDSVHLSSALLTAIHSHLTLTGDTKDNIVTFPDQATRINLASGDKHAALFGKIKRWFTDLKALAFKDKVGKADLDTALQTEIDGKANKTDIPTSLPANGGNANSVGGYVPSFLMKRNSGTEIQADAILGTSQYGFGYENRGFPISGSFISFGGFSDDYTTQIIASYKGDKIYFRTYDGDLKKWNIWQRLAHHNEVLQKSGDQTLTNGRFYLNSSAPEHVFMIQGAGTNWGYFGFGAYPTRNLHIYNYATGKYLDIAADGKLRYDTRELAFKEDIPVSMNDVADAFQVIVDSDQIIRKVIVCNLKKEQGYLSRAAIGLTNPGFKFSPVIISAGLNDQGTAWADWKFDPENGRIVNPDGKLFALTNDLSGTLKNSGDQLISGNLTLNTGNASYLNFHRNGQLKGIVGCTATGDTRVVLQNSASGAVLQADDDGKCYYNSKEIATTDQISNLVTLNTSQTITGTKIFTQYCDFKGGAGNSGSDMRFKGKVRPLGEVLPDLLDLNVIRYEWNKEGEEKRDTFGISAMELADKGDVFGQIVHERDDEQRTKWVEYDRIGVLALKGMQEMYRQWETEKQELNRELSVLKRELAELRGVWREWKEHH
nr:MAG TPA: Receptor recognition protein, Long tail, Helical sandwich, Tail fiber [Caudoviricetes sp.]